MSDWLRRCAVIVGIVAIATGDERVLLLTLALGVAAGIGYMVELRRHW
jgi:hypothetical protein